MQPATCDFFLCRGRLLILADFSAGVYYIAV